MTDNPGVRIAQQCRELLATAVNEELREQLLVWAKEFACVMTGPDSPVRCPEEISDG